MLTRNKKHLPMLAVMVASGVSWVAFVALVVASCFLITKTTPSPLGVTSMLGMLGTGGLSLGLTMSWVLHFWQLFTRWAAE